jgi:perosamine synthetase
MLLDEIRSAVRTTVQDLVENDQWQSYQGRFSQQLQQQLANHLQQTHVELCSSGTAALEILLRAAGIAVGDEVLLSAYDYPGNFWAIERVGARPVLVDVEPNSWNIDFDSLEFARTSDCKALVVSHLHGLIQPVDRLVRWCDERGMILIEDACQNPGAIYRGQPTGSFGHAAILSFGGGKILSTGRGGAWATSNARLAQKARIAAGAGSGPYTMSEMQSAVVLAQVPWLDRINATCRRYFDDLNQAFNACKVNWIRPAIQPPVPSTDITSIRTAYYQAGWILADHCDKDPANSTSNTRDALIAELRSPNHNHLVASIPPFGIGFPGFHRRSNRRCRIAATLVNAPLVAARTIVLHHSIAMEKHWQSQQLANWVKTCLSRL